MSGKRENTQMKREGKKGKEAGGDCTSAGDAAMRSETNRIRRIRIELPPARHAMRHLPRQKQ